MAFSNPHACETQVERTVYISRCGCHGHGEHLYLGGRCMPQIEMCVNTERNSGLCVHRGAGRRERRARGKEMGMLDVCLEV